MSAKHPIFPPGGPNRGGQGGGRRPPAFDDDDSLYTGHPQPADFGMTRPQEPGAAGRAAKGRAAYAAQDPEIPSQPTTGLGGGHGGHGFGSLGGLFAGGAQHDFEAPDTSGTLLNTDELLSIVSDDRLREECRARVCPTCPVKKESEDAHLRALADLDNAKKRLAREREEQVRFAAESVLSDILPFLDNLDLALQHSDSYKNCKDFVVGVQMTRKLLLDALAKHGLAQAGAVGEAFDPALHEAVGMVDVPDVADNHICSLLVHGYTLNGRLLRPARVMVCKKG